MLSVLLSIVGVSAAAQLSADVDYRMDPGATTAYSSDADTGLEGDLEFVFEDDGGMHDDDSLLHSGSGDMSGPMPTVGGGADGAVGSTVAAPLPASGGFGALGLALLAVRRRR